MTTYEATWPATGRATLNRPEQVDQVLLPLHNLGQPIVVDVFRYRDGRPDGGVQIGVGHPDRSFVLYFGYPEGGYAVDLASAHGVATSNSAMAARPRTITLPKPGSPRTGFRSCTATRRHRRAAHVRRLGDQTEADGETAGHGQFSEDDPCG